MWLACGFIIESLLDLGTNNLFVWRNSGLSCLNPKNPLLSYAYTRSFQRAQLLRTICFIDHWITTEYSGDLVHSSLLRFLCSDWESFYSSHRTTWSCHFPTPKSHVTQRNRLSLVFQLGFDQSTDPNQTKYCSMTLELPTPKTNQTEQMQTFRDFRWLKGVLLTIFVYR